MTGSTLQVLICTYLFTISVVTEIVKKSRNICETKFAVFYGLFRTERNVISDIGVY